MNPLYLTGSDSINWDRANKAKLLIGKALNDFKEFKPLIDLFMNSDRHKEDKEWHRIYGPTVGRTYEQWLDKSFQIGEISYEGFTVILPGFMNKLNIEREDEYYILFDKCVGEIINKK